MTDTSTDVFWEDNFARDDSTTLGGDWTGTGDLQIINNSMRQSTGSVAKATLTVPATTAAAQLTGDYAVTAKVSCDDDDTARKGRIMLRYADSLQDGYSVGLEWDGTGASEVLTLQIFKTTGGTTTAVGDSATVTTEANLVDDSHIDVIQNIGAAIYDTVDGVVIQAFFNDEQRPRLEYTDRKYPTWKQSGSIGFEFVDSDAGVNGHVFLHGFRVVALVDTEEAFEVNPRLHTLGYMRDRVRERSLRDSQSNYDTAAFTQFINECNQELHAYLVNPPWMIETYRFQMVSGNTQYELPRNTRTIDDIIYDVGNQLPLQVLDLQQWRRLGFTDTTGQPELFYMAGYGRGGGPVIKPYPRPSEGATFEAILRKSPAQLINDDDIPELPEEFCDALIWGAVHLYTLRDSDRSHMNAAMVKWEQWKRRIKRSVNRSEHIAQQGNAVHAFMQRGGKRTVIQNARYGIRRH